MAVQTAEEWLIEARIAESQAEIDRIAREIFGDEAYVHRNVHEDPETGEEWPVLEVHYCFPDWDDEYDRLVALHEMFMHAAVPVISPEIRGRVVLMTIPMDGGPED